MARLFVDVEVTIYIYIRHQSKPYLSRIDVTIVHGIKTNLLIKGHLH